MQFALPALVFLFSFHSGIALECLVINRSINYVGFVNDPEWHFCDIQLARAIDEMSASGVSGKNDEIDRYHALMDAEPLGGPAIFRLPFICFVEETIVHNQPSKMERCICSTERCNTYEHLPEFLLHKMAHVKKAINGTITPQQMFELQKTESLRQYHNHH